MGQVYSKVGRNINIVSLDRLQRHMNGESIGNKLQRDVHGSVQSINRNELYIDGRGMRGIVHERVGNITDSN